MTEPALDPIIDQAIDDAVVRVFDTMRRAAPMMAEKAARWAEDLAVVGGAASYFKHLRAFPSLLIPRWIEESAGLAADVELQRQLVYSSINGYYFIRLVDNIMDGHATDEAEFLPAAAFFHTESVDAFRPLFDMHHPFWDAFKQTWYTSAELTVKDRVLGDKTADDFREIASRKVNAAKIPLLAICHLRQRTDLIAPWSDWIDRFGMWHLFEEDLFDWHRDLADGVSTYFLSEGARRKRSDESIEAWTLREGMEWGVTVLREWMPELEEATASLGSPGAIAYVDARGKHLERHVKKLAPGMALLASLTSAQTAMAE